MSIIKKSGLKQAAIATERGWETYDGKLVISSKNLLTNRVVQNIAVPEEVKRWSEGQLIEIEDRKNRIISSIETNEQRLKDLTDKFDKSTKDINKSSNTAQQIEYLQKKIEFLKIVAEYEKSFKASYEELERLNTRGEKVQSKLNVVLPISPKLMESKSEHKDVSSEASEKKKQENSVNKPIEPPKVEVPKRQRKKPGPKSKAEKLAEAQKLANYPIPSEETIDE